MKMRKKKHIKRHPPKQYPLSHWEITPEMLEKVKQLMDNLSKKLASGLYGKFVPVPEPFIPDSQQRECPYAS